MATRPEGAWTIEDLCDLVYLGVNQVEKKHRVSVLRAVKNIVPDMSPIWSCLGVMARAVRLCLSIARSL